MYESVLPKYLALTFDRFYEMPHGVDEDLASIRAPHACTPAPTRAAPTSPRLRTFRRFPPQSWVLR